VSGLTGPVGRAERESLRLDVRRLGRWFESTIVPTTDSDPGLRDGGTLGHNQPHDATNRINFNAVTVSD